MKGQNKNILLIKFSYLIHILIVIDFIILSSNKLLCCFIKFIYIYISKIIKSICVDPHFWGSFFSLLCNSFFVRCHNFGWSCATSREATMESH